MKKIRMGMAILIAILAFAALFAEDTYADGSIRLLPPSSDYPFGTDSSGRDLLGRICGGILVSFSIAIPVTLISAAGGIVLSFGFTVQKFPSAAVLSLSDSMKSIPPIILALFLNALSGPGILKLISALSIGNIPVIARMCHSRISVLRTDGPVMAAECMGIGRMRIFISHILPHLFPYLMLESVSIFSSSILTEASLSYLGCGVPPTLPSLGSILSDARSVVLVRPSMALIPAAILLLLGIALELIAKGLSETYTASH